MRLKLSELKLLLELFGWKKVESLIPNDTTYEHKDCFCHQGDTCSGHDLYDLADSLAQLIPSMKVTYE